MGKPGLGNSDVGFSNDLLCRHSYSELYDVAFAENGQYDNDYWFADRRCRRFNLVHFPPEEREGACYQELGTPVRRVE